MEYPVDKKPDFRTALAHYRKSLKKGFLYEEQSSGVYEVRLGTLQESAAAHRGLRYVQSSLKETELEAMMKDTSVSRDWVTIVLLSMRCGIPGNTGRHLRWQNVDMETAKIEVLMRSALYPIYRHMTDDLVDHLKQIRPQQADPESPLCPSLAALTPKAYHDGWPILRKKLNLPQSHTLSALTWPWKSLNPGLRDREIIGNHIAALERKWLSPVEIAVSAKLGCLADNITPLIDKHSGNAAQVHAAHETQPEIKD